MPSPPREWGSRRGQRGVLAALGALLAAGGLGLAAAGLAGQQPAIRTSHEISPSGAASSNHPRKVQSPSASTPGNARPSASRSMRANSAKPKRDAAEPAQLPESVPTKIRIPAIGVSSRFVELNVGQDGQVQAPADPSTVGWFVGAHTPGSPGVAVVAGHVTWNRAPAVFFRLGQLGRGDVIAVDRADGSAATFAVTGMSTFPKTRFPTDQVYRQSDQPQLVLITCGGSYSFASHSYDSNVIVWARIVRTRRA